MIGFSLSAPSCEAPVPPANGDIDYDGLTLNSGASIECNTGYRLLDNEPNTITCHMPDGALTPTWGYIPACEGTLFSHFTLSAQRAGDERFPQNPPPPKKKKKKNATRRINTD